MNSGLSENSEGILLGLFPLCVTVVQTGVNGTATLGMWPQGIAAQLERSDGLLSRPRQPLRSSRSPTDGQLCDASRKGGT